MGLLMRVVMTYYVVVQVIAVRVDAVSVLCSAGDRSRCLTDACAQRFIGEVEGGAGVRGNGGTHVCTGSAVSV